jgi:hypothetical protein
LSADKEAIKPTLKVLGHPRNKYAHSGPAITSLRGASMMSGENRSLSLENLRVIFLDKRS